jgi:ArsR family transcriptional regulator
MLSEQEFFDVLSDPIRRRILVLLMGEGELCVCELYQALDMPQPKISRHLGVMREADVLTMRREGTWIYYRIHPQLPLWAYRLLEALAQGTQQAALYRDDDMRLQSMTGRPARCCA